MTAPGPPQVPVAELEEPAPWRSPVPFLWLAIAMLLTGAAFALLTGAADPPDEEDARARIVAAAGSTAAVDFAFSMSMAFEESDEPSLENVWTTMEGRYDADTQRMAMRSSATQGYEMESVTDGTVLYLRFPAGSVFDGATGGKPWGRVEHPERSGSRDDRPITENPLHRLAELGRLRSPVVRVGEEQVRGVDTVRFRTTIAGATVANDAEEAELEVWLDDDDQLRRYRLAATVRGTRYRMAFEAFDVGVPVTVELPPEDQVGPFDPAAMLRDRFPSAEGD